MAAYTSWRKSTFSEGAGSACVEVAWRKSSLSEGGESASVEVGWQKSSFSEGAQSDCVEVAHTVTGTAVRDSKNPDGPILSLPLPAWGHLLTTVAAPALPHTVGGRP